MATATILKFTLAFLLIGFLAFAVIPTFIAASLSKASNACVNNLRLIDGAKSQWALEHHKLSNDVPTIADIGIYLNNEHKLPVCPDEGIYTIGRLDQDPTCSISTSAWPNSHVLKDTNSWWGNCVAAYGALFHHI